MFSLLSRDMSSRRISRGGGTAPSPYKSGGGGGLRLARACQEREFRAEAAVASLPQRRRSPGAAAPPPWEPGAGPKCPRPPVWTLVRCRRGRRAPGATRGTGGYWCRRGPWKPLCRGLPEGNVAPAPLRGRVSNPRWARLCAGPAVGRARRGRGTRGGRAFAGAQLALLRGLRLGPALRAPPKAPGSPDPRGPQAEERPWRRGSRSPAMPALFSAFPRCAPRARPSPGAPSLGRRRLARWAGARAAGRADRERGSARWFLSTLTPPSEGAQTRAWRVGSALGASAPVRGAFLGCRLGRVGQPVPPSPLSRGRWEMPPAQD